MEKAYRHGANPKHFAKVSGTPVCIVCEPFYKEEAK
jgi:hypothetical protein